MIEEEKLKLLNLLDKIYQYEKSICIDMILKPFFKELKKKVKEKLKNVCFRCKKKYDYLFCDKYKLCYHCEELLNEMEFNYYSFRDTTVDF